MLLLGGLFAALACIIIDSLYFTWTHERLVFVIAPLNALLYNTKTSNLADHGLHPHYLHLINLVILFGPVGIIGVKNAAQLQVRMLFGRRQIGKSDSLVVQQSKYNFT